MAKVDYKALLEEAKQQKMEAERVIAFAERMLGVARRPSDSTSGRKNLGKLSRFKMTRSTVRTSCKPRKPIWKWSGGQPEAQRRSQK